MKIKEMKKFKIGVYNEIVELLPQLSTRATTPTKKYFKDILKSKDTHFFVAKSDEKVIGTLLLTKYKTLCGTKYWIEDVIVDESQRGKGYGRDLTQFAIDYAKYDGATSIYLTSQPARVAANILYQNMGFMKYETNMYKYNFE
jgi:ribosomal protein S18 acetylase RimI-like enzyme